ncbi:MAG: hypothetical protein E6614_18645, partial [Bradyrhizobium sp.]|nr:hypothetical protein [Bradyrhizobium sp.]
MSNKNSSSVTENRHPNPSESQQSPAADGRPDLVIDQADLPAAASELAERLANSPSLFQRGSAVVKLVKTSDGFSTLILNAHDVVNYSHQVCRPVLQKILRGEMVREPVTLPERVAKLYLNRHDAWGVRPIDGICRAPILSDDGSIRATHGYDKETRFWCTG